MFIVILQPVKPLQHPFKAVLILTLYSSQLYTFSNEEITKPGIQCFFYFFCNGQRKQGVGQEYKGCCILSCHELPVLSLIQPVIFLAGKQTVPIHV